MVVADLIGYAGASAKLDRARHKNKRGGAGMTRKASTRDGNATILHLVIELFFALLPLFVLGWVWPEHGQEHPKGFLSGPEWSMTACVLYGLACARLQLGAAMPARDRGETRPLVLTTLGLIPLFGSLASVILITKFANGNDSPFMVALQLMNLGAAILVFFVIGG